MIAAAAAILDWLMQPIDSARGHAIAAVVAWHGRLMVLAWAVLFPCGVMAARFFKITRRQDWPKHLDNKTWWRAHLLLQYSGGCAVLLGVCLMLQYYGPWVATIHGLLGSVATIACLLQFLSGWLRGSKGGPTQPNPDGSLSGDHYDMTTRRLVFERVHKSVGYVALMVALVAMLTGLWTVNAPRWMWFSLLMWWTALICAGIQLQLRGRAFDTYQAIWGPDPTLPGNRRAAIGWRVSRLPPKDKT